MFNIESDEQVRLEIYNLTGAKVSEPFSGNFAPGEHQVTFSIEALPAGIFIGRLVAGNKAYTSKFVKIR